MVLTLTARFARLLASLMVVGGLVMPMAAAQASTAEPRDNDSNAIIWGGCYSKAECVDKINHGDGHNSAANIQQILLHEGRAMTLANFNSSDTVDGTVFKDGRVVVGGKTVADGGVSIGRHQMAGSIKSGSVWQTPNQQAFVADSIPAFVNMQGGTFHYFVIKSCANFGTAKPKPTPTPSPTPKPTPTPTPTPTPVLSFSCVSLTPSQPDKTNHPTTFRFTVTPHVQNVTLTGFRFSFSDNSPVVDTDANQPFIERDVPSGSLKVNGQVKTSAGITAVSEACSALVNVTPASTPTPTPPGQVLGVTLPATGPETALGGMVGLSALTVASRSYLRSRRSLLASLRRSIKR